MDPVYQCQEKNKCSKEADYQLLTRKHKFWTKLCDNL